MPVECLEGYVHMLEILVTKYGIPENFYSDKYKILINSKEEETAFILLDNINLSNILLQVLF